MIRVIHRGSVRTAAVLASCLRNEGLEIRHEPRMETRDAGVSGPELIVIAVLGSAGGNLTADAVKAAVKRGIDKFHDRSHGRFPVVIEGEPDPSTQE